MLPGRSFCVFFIANNSFLILVSPMALQYNIGVAKCPIGLLQAEAINSIFIK